MLTGTNRYCVLNRYKYRYKQEAHHDAFIYSIHSSFVVATYELE